MTNKKVKGLKTWLKQNNYTYEQMQAYWDELISLGHTKVQMLSKAGLNWDETNLSIIEELPNAKEKFIKYREEKEKQRLAEEDAKKKALEQKAYYDEHFEEIMLNKIDNKEELSEDEIKRLVYDYGVELTFGDNRRWTRSANSIIQLQNRFFKITWEQGLTENQENVYDGQPVEVEKHTYEKTITVTEWRAIR